MIGTKDSTENKTTLKNFTLYLFKERISSIENVLTYRQSLRVS